MREKMTDTNTQKLAYLRECVRNEVSEKRYRHILRVEECAVDMAEYYMDILSDNDMYCLRAAAILHDVTKDKGDEWQKSFVRENNVNIPSGDEASPQLMHSFTAPYYVALKYPEFATEQVLSATYTHTTGSSEMSLTDKIICLADYIEYGRAYDSCVRVRNEFFDPTFFSTKRSENERMLHLDVCLLDSLIAVKEHLVLNGEKLSKKTAGAIDTLRIEIAELTKAVKKQTEINFTEET